jgi:hypothetical protein
VILYNSDFFYLKNICLSRGWFSNRSFMEWNQAEAAAAEILKRWYWNKCNLIDIQKRPAIRTDEPGIGLSEWQKILKISFAFDNSFSYNCIKKWGWFFVFLLTIEVWFYHSFYGGLMGTFDSVYKFERESYIVMEIGPLSRLVIIEQESFRRGERGWEWETS